MLIVKYGMIDGIVRRPALYFDNTYDPEWLNDELVKEMILDVDKSKVIGPRLIDSPYLGPISPKDISKGVKTLILMLKDTNDKIFYASGCGDNCAKWILKIAKERDLTINLRHIMDFGAGPYEIKFDNTGVIAGNKKEYLDAIIDIEERERKGGHCNEA